MTNLTEKQKSLLYSIHNNHNKESIKNSMNIWLTLADSKVWISDGNTNYWYDLGKEFEGYLRKDVYEIVVNYKNTGTKVTVAIPIDDGLYLTVCRSGSGNLVVGEKIYRNLETLKRHNSMVPRGLTSEELLESPIK